MTRNETRRVSLRLTNEDTYFVLSSFVFLLVEMNRLHDITKHFDHSFVATLIGLARWAGLGCRNPSWIAP